MVLDAKSLIGDGLAVTKEMTWRLIDGTKRD